MFGFTGGALWAIQDTSIFTPGHEQGLLVIFMISATLSFLLSAVWSVLMLLMSGLMLDEELHSFLKHTGLLELLPLFLFLIGIVFVALGLFWWLWIILYQEQLPYLVVAYFCLAVLAGQSLYTFITSVQGLFAARKEYLEGEAVAYSNEAIQSHLQEYSASARESMSPDGFVQYLIDQYPEGRSGTIRHMPYITRQRAQRAFEDYVEHLLSSSSS